MKVGTTDSRNVLERAAGLLNVEDNPFTAEVDGDRLIVTWRWKDAMTFGFSSVSNEVREFRYVVVLGDRNTFYGYDSHNSVGAQASVRGTGIGSGTFEGHEYRYHREIAIGKDNDGGQAGIKEWGFSSRQIHDAVKKVFTGMGYRYHEPAITWVESSSPKTYLFLGVLFGFIGLMFMAISFAENVLPMGIIAGVFLLTALWAGLVGLKIAKVPVPSLKAAVIGTLSFIGIAFMLIFFGLFIYLAMAGGQIR